MISNQTIPEEPEMVEKISFENEIPNNQIIIQEVKLSHRKKTIEDKKNSNGEQTRTEKENEPKLNETPKLIKRKLAKVITKDVEQIG